MSTHLNNSFAIRVVNLQNLLIFHSLRLNRELIKIVNEIVEVHKLRKGVAKVFGGVPGNFCHVLQNDLDAGVVADFYGMMKCRENFLITFGV